MITITATIFNWPFEKIWVPIMVGSIDQGRSLRPGEFFQVPTDLWNMQVIAQEMANAANPNRTLVAA